jgi:glycerophosphoryl diester phosphodiesterase
MTGRLKLAVGLLIIGVAAAAVFIAAHRADARRALAPLVKAARGEVHLFLFKRNFQGLKGEAPYSEPTLLVIAHAGGAVGGKSYRNAMEGLAQSAERGCRFMEVDFNWTADGKLVAIHDWTSFFDEPLEAIPTEREFLERIRADGLTQMTFAHVAAWLARHPRLSLVTDVKERNLDALRLMAATGLQAQIVPQIYRLSEFDEVRQLGFPRVIFTNYVMQYSESVLARFAAVARPFAITVPRAKASGSLARELAAAGVPLFTHTLDTVAEVEALPRRIKGVYSGTLCGLNRAAE